MTGRDAPTPPLPPSPPSHSTTYTSSQNLYYTYITEHLLPTEGSHISHFTSNEIIRRANTILLLRVYMVITSTYTCICTHVHTCYIYCIIYPIHCVFQHHSWVFVSGVQTLPIPTPEKERVKSRKTSPLTHVSPWKGY